MPLVTFDLFAAIDASFFTGILGFHALRINDAITGYGTTSRFLATADCQLIQAFLPDTTLVPPAKMIRRRSAREENRSASVVTGYQGKHMKISVVRKSEGYIWEDCDMADMKSAKYLFSKSMNNFMR
jgi:hypothetical protein